MSKRERERAKQAKRVAKAERKAQRKDTPGAENAELEGLFPEEMLSGGAAAASEEAGEAGGDDAKAGPAGKPRGSSPR